MITRSDKANFLERGFLKVTGLIPPTKITPAREAVWQCLEKQGYRAGSALRGSGVAAGANLVKPIRKSGTFQSAIRKEVREVIAHLLDRDPPPADDPQLLFTLPNADQWELPHSVWHLDVPRLADFDSVGVQIFTFLDCVEPGGGGTLIVAGSHRLLNTGEFIRSKDVKRRLKRDPWFRALMSKQVTDRQRFMRETDLVDGVEVQVIELVGEPGDVYFVDLRTLHTLSPNTSDRPRMMLTQRYILEECIELLFSGTK